MTARHDLAMDSRPPPNRPPEAHRRPRVGALVWTYNRFDVLLACINSLRSQAYPPDVIVVADSASPDRSGARIAASRLADSVVTLKQNDGMGAAIAAGLAELLQHDVDYVWFVEDDALAGPNALGELIEIAESDRGFGVVGTVGALMRGGRWKWQYDLSDQEVDFCMLDGSLVRTEVIRVCGVPRSDFFVMLTDVEYPLRFKTVGARSFAHRTSSYSRGQLGAGNGSTAWRAYYQTRNHLRLVIDARSPSLLFGFLMRTLGLIRADLTRRPPARDQVRLRVRGVVDAATGRMGRTVDPPVG